MAKKNLILAFESSCDETSVAVIEDGQKILSNIVATQILSHQRFGGVVPEVAS
ncbi:tRNA (adenosine(37)-N6)-threonylcarbamoyltransferase complex transferase subunit TsaD, partial [Limosilactobacillus mucosae]